MSKKKEDPRTRIVVWVNADYPPGIKVFSTRALFSHSLEEYITRGDLFERPEDADGHFTEGLAIARDIFEIAGVQSVVIDQYNIEVEISLAFDWKEDRIESQVLEKIRNHLAMWAMTDDLSNRPPRPDPPDAKPPPET